MQVEAYFGQALAEQADGQRQGRVFQADQAVHRADLQAFPGQPAEAVGLQAKAFDIAEQALGRIEELVAFLGQLEAAAAAPAEGAAEALLEITHRDAEA
ncbi:hypothetical protein D3C84_1078650 [compost metagenome]